MQPNVLFICGSLNQTTMMHQIAQRLADCRCCFTPYYATGLFRPLARSGLLDWTILGGRHRRNTDAYLAQHQLPVDFGGRARNYELVVTCSDLLVQANVRRKPLVLVQEGITEPENPFFWLVKTFKLPRYWANTAATGLSDAYDLFCVASPGYRDFFIRKGVRAEKIAVTGIPNFDNAAQYSDNSFPHRGYVLVATSDMRETGKWDDRARFIVEAREIAAGRQMIFKLHPNEQVERAIAEIETYAPSSLIFSTGDINPMVANCDVLITQYSSVVFVGLALGKAVHSCRDVDELRRLTPIQNGGQSADLIASHCRRLIEAETARRPSAAAGGVRPRASRGVGLGTASE
jgi:hypothetical protein